MLTFLSSDNEPDMYIDDEGRFYKPFQVHGSRGAGSWASAWDLIEVFVMR